MLPAILGLSGETLSADERAFFRDANPAGFILFARNCRDRAQVKALTADLRSLRGRDDLPILIDQEGGRVARLKPPEWPVFPAGGRFAELYETAPISAMEAVRANAQALAVTLTEIGINVDCLPVLDIPAEGAHDVIGDRALGHEPMRVAALGRAALDGLEDGGCIGVAKHMPGHGRATADSHVELPVVNADADALESDIMPFRALKNAPMAMTAHVLYPAWDAERCATLSATIIAEVIRGKIGFNGLLMSDDIAMEALSGGAGDRARAAIDAGCDVVLHCSGVLAESRAVAERLETIGAESRMRLDRAMVRTLGAKSADYAELAAKRDALLAYAV